MDGSRVILECLIKEGVDIVFGYPGGAVIPLYDALYDYKDKIKHIRTSHEQGAVHAADGYARSSGNVGVCFLTSGPGATNAITGIATAYMDSSPMVCFSGQVPTSLLGKDSFQEIDITGVTLSVTKHNFLIRDAKDLPKTIKEAFENTKAFSSFYISMVATGEMSGNLDEVMDKLSIYYDKEQKLKSKIVSILIYPAILVVSMIISFTAILIFLIPNFEEIYADNTIQTPLITKILIFLSHLIRDDFILIIGIIVLTIGGFIYFKKNSQKFNEILNKLYFKTPLVKTFNQLIITNKFVKALSILISSGVQIVYSIETSAKVMDNDYIYQKICESNELIKKGNSIGSSLKKVEELPSLFLSMVVIGEESGRLDNILGTVSEYYENELDSKLERGTKYFENFLTLFIGIIVGIAVISMMMPMFDAVASI